MRVGQEIVGPAQFSGNKNEDGVGFSALGRKNEINPVHPK
jgi:hypothetical protein